MVTDKKTWIVFANNNICKHADAIKDLGFINWVMGKRFHFSIGDTVYLFMSNERAVRYKMIVVAENCDREDKDYWIEAPEDKTYKLKLLKRYNGNLLTEEKLSEHGFKGGKSIQNPSYCNHELIEYIDTVFASDTVSASTSKDIAQRPMLIVDLNSGSYIHTKRGHEEYNLQPNPTDGRFYGYCPPHDTINISNLGACKDAESISGVTVIYTTKQRNSNDREIIAFCENATIHRKGIHNEKLQRTIQENGKTLYCTYTIESDTLNNLTNFEPKFIIHIADYNTYMFRKQRIFKNKYPTLDKHILKYIKNYLNWKDSTDDLLYQESIQDEDDYNPNSENETLTQEPQYSVGADGKSVKRNPKTAKQSLANSEYKCAMDEHHTTFKTNKGIPYMEGHHLIPCTYLNAQYFWKTMGRNIDCTDNIICLCPTCHRKIHYASNKEKEDMIKYLYEKKKDRFNEIGLKISLQELLKLYNI